jgi:hypothetical protein
MDTRARSRRLLLTALTAALAAVACLAACGAQGRGAPVGTSTAVHARAWVANDGGATAADAGIPLDFEASMRKMNAAPFTTNGHAAGRWDADVYANEAGATALREGRTAAAGAKLVMVHRERAGGAAGARGPTMMMEKEPAGYAPEHGDWRYVVIASSGELVKDGPIPSCAGCHDDAPHDRVFGLTP